MTPQFTVAALIILALLGGFLYWLFRPKPLGELPRFKASWRKLLRKHVNYYGDLSKEDRRRFEERMRYFFQQVDITGIETEVTELDRVLVAASGIIPTFGFDKWNHYPRLREVLLYKDHFRYGDFATEGEDRRIAGMVGGGYMSGKLLLSRPALHQGFRNAGRNNTGIHEFVHLLDKADGDTNGIPRYFLENGFMVPWVEMIRSEMEAIERGESDIDDYATTNKAEFFAVAAEYFFNRPAAFSDKHPRLFALMERIFSQDMDDDGGIGTVSGADPLNLQAP
ncbi:zinc-dependent peptidase [Lewinella sp. W8]|uniref:M90 family metallopeptidase n=1 Tax=Lewinella sp. W8 TaxID=2528208 RepID=UPI0010674B58|nr:M90 family metallopeptidase [Lewinella sp. W8]MTB53244.1 peptidase [Lewinella sp. W8]